MNLTIWKLTGTGRDLICTSSASGFTGALVCNIGTETGEFEALVFRSASPPQPITSLYITASNAVSSLDYGLKIFLGIIIAIFVVIIGIFAGPIASIIMMPVAGAILLFLDITTWPIVAGMIVLSLVVYQVLKNTG